MRNIINLIKVGVILIAILFAVSSLSSSVKTASAQACTAPAQVTGVKIDFPSCVGDQCNLTQANCSWTAVTGATKYQVTVTEVESSTVVKNEQVTATNDVFNVNQNKTYKCDVSAVNACGASGLAGTFSLFCKVDPLVSPTAVPPTQAPPPPRPTLPPTGTISTSVAIGLVSMIFLTIGAFLVVL